MAKTYCVYIMANNTNTVLYTGMSGNLVGRVYQHRNKLVEGFTKRYNATKLVYFETTGNVRSAIQREKQIKAGSRKKKIDLIMSMNPEFEDLYDYITGEREWTGPPWKEI